MSYTYNPQTGEGSYYNTGGGSSSGGSSTTQKTITYYHTPDGKKWTSESAAIAHGGVDDISVSNYSGGSVIGRTDTFYISPDGRRWTSKSGAKAHGGISQTLQRQYSGGKIIGSQLSEITPLKSPKPDPSATPIRQKSIFALDPTTGKLTSKDTAGLLISNVMKSTPPEPTIQPKQSFLGGIVTRYERGKRVIYDTLVPGFKEERLKIEAETERQRKIEQSRLNFVSEIEAKLTGDQAQARIDKESRVSQHRQIEEGAASQGIINQAAIDRAANLQGKVDLGLISVETAQSQLDLSTKLSTKLAQAQLDISAQIEGRRLQNKVESENIYLQEQHEKYFVPYIETQIKESEQRIQSNLSKSIYGIPGLQVGEFDMNTYLSIKGRKVPILKDVIAAKAFERDILVTRAAELKSQRTSPLKDIKKWDFSKSTFKEFNIAQQQIGTQIGITKKGIELGLFTKPATTIGTGLTIATLGFGTAMVAPKIIQAAAKGSRAAKVMMGVGKATSIGLAGGFLGVQGVRAGLAPTRLQREVIIGETIGIGTAAIVGGAVGSKAGGKLLNFLNARKPSITTYDFTQQQIGSGISTSKLKGKVTRGKYEFEFTGKEVEGIGKGFRFAKTAEIKPTFAGRKLPTIKTKSTGRLQPGQSDVGASLFGGGKVTATGTKTQPFDFRVFKGGEVYGKIGRVPFRSKLLNPPKTTGAITTFKGVEISAGKPRVQVKRAISEGVTLPGKLLLGVSGTKPYPFDSFIPRIPGAINQPRVIANIKPISIRTEGRGIAQLLEIPTIQGRGIITPLTSGGAKITDINISRTKMDLLNENNLLSSVISEPTSKIRVATETIIDVPTKGGTTAIVGGDSRGGSKAGTSATDIVDVIGGAIVEPITETDVITETEITARTTTKPRMDFPFNFRPPSFDFIFLGLPSLPGGGGGSGGRGRRKVRGRTTKYQPSLSAVGLKIFGKAPKPLTGLQYRPIPISLKPKKTKKKKKGLLKTKVGFRL